MQAGVHLPVKRTFASAPMVTTGNSLPFPLQTTGTASETPRGSVFQLLRAFLRSWPRFKERPRSENDHTMVILTVLWTGLQIYTYTSTILPALTCTISWHPEGDSLRICCLISTESRMSCVEYNLMGSPIIAKNILRQISVQQKRHLCIHIYICVCVYVCMCVCVMYWGS